MRTLWQSTNENMSDLEWCFIPLPNNTCRQTALTVSPWTPKSSSSLLSRLDNPVLKAGILFAQWFLSALIAFDLMRGCNLLVDSGQPQCCSNGGMIQGNKAGLSFSTCNYQINMSLCTTDSINIICCLHYSFCCQYWLKDENLESGPFWSYSLHISYHTLAVCTYLELMTQSWYKV